MVQLRLPPAYTALWFALVLAVGVFLGAWGYHVPMHYLVLVGAVVGMAWQLLT